MSNEREPNASWRNASSVSCVGSAFDAKQRKLAGIGYRLRALADAPPQRHLFFADLARLGYDDGRLQG